MLDAEPPPAYATERIGQVCRNLCTAPPPLEPPVLALAKLIYEELFPVSLHLHTSCGHTDYGP